MFIAKAKAAFNFGSRYGNAIESNLTYLRTIVSRSISLLALKHALWLRVVVIVVGIFNFPSQTAIAQEKIEFCSSGSIALAKFKQHIVELRKSRRYSSEMIDKLISDERSGGPEFFSSQIVIKEEQSASGDYDLNLFPGFADPQVEYRSQMKWACEADDYPIAYFVGFKVREIRDPTIIVSREKSIVNVISLKQIAPNLDRHISVRDFQRRSVLCADIGAGCTKEIFYGRY